MALVRKPLTEGGAGSARKYAEMLANRSELIAAAQILETAGDVEAAADLRVELARTIPDLKRRIALLRETAARMPVDSPSARAAHGELARALQDAAIVGVPSHERHALTLERAHALERAGNADEAGSLYESLGLNDRALKAYEAGGCLTELEYLHLTQEHLRKAADKRREIDDVLRLAIAAGRRREAKALLEQLKFEASAMPDGHLVQTGQLEHYLHRQHPHSPVRIAMRYGSEQLRLTLWAGRSLRFGRAPHLEVHGHSPSLSREHAQLILTGEAPHFALEVHDLRSKTGTFLDGEAVIEPLIVDRAGQYRLDLGAEDRFNLSLEYQPSATTCTVTTADSADAFADRHLTQEVEQLVPVGAKLAVPSGCSYELIFAFEADSFPRLDVAADLHVQLNGRKLRRGAEIDLLRGDKIIVHRPDAPALHLEILP